MAQLYRRCRTAKAIFPPTALDDKIEALVQDKYDRQIQAYKKMLMQDGYRHLIRLPDGSSCKIPVYFSSGKTRKILVDRYTKITLKIVRLRSTVKDIPYSETIIPSLFVPNHQVTLYDLWEIQNSAPYSKDERSYRFSVTHTEKICRNARNLFKLDDAAMETLSDQDVMLLRDVQTAQSFEEFFMCYDELLHRRDLASKVFKTSISMIYLK